MCVLQEPLPAASADFLLDQIFPLSPGVIAQLDAGTTMLVTGCGQGEIVLELARRFPRSLFAGTDAADWNIVAARRAAVAAGLANVWFETGDAFTQRFGRIFHLVVSLDASVPAPSLPLLLEALQENLRGDGLLFVQLGTELDRRDFLHAGFVTAQRFVSPLAPHRPLYVARR
jgi:trans-aconitate methyltransferase